MAKKKDMVDKAVERLDQASLANPLINALRDNDKKNLFKSNTVSCFHKTGFHLFDYYFGSVVNIHNEFGEIVSQEPRLGQAAGTFNVVVAKTGVGKTTFVVQIASNIMRQFPSSTIHHYDFEQRFSISRGQAVSKLPISDFDENSGRYILKSGAISLEELQEAIIQVYTYKMKNKNELSINTKQLDEFGREITVLIPTIFIIDSISQVITSTFSVDNSKDVNDAKELRGNTEGARDAKTIRGFFKDILPLCKEANIIIYAINHITTNMSMSAFAPPSKQQMFLKVDEAIPGGTAQFFNAFNFIKMVAKPNDDFTEEKDGFNGYMVMFEPCKSSSNQSGNDSKGVSFEMVFSYKHGFDSLRSLIVYGRGKGIIEGNAPRLKFRDDPSFTFAFKEIDKEKDEKPIWDCIMKYIIPELKTHLSFIEPSDARFDDRSMNY